MIWKTKGMPRTQQLRAFYQHRYWTQAQDLVIMEAYWWTKSKCFHFLSKENISGEGLPHYLSTKNYGWYPSISSLKQRAASWEAQTILTLLHLQRKGSPTTSCCVADYRPESQHYLRVIRPLGFSLESQPNFYATEAYPAEAPYFKSHHLQKRKYLLDVAYDAGTGTLWISHQPYMII